jgi:PBP1b-binding outer membrane lipoprotein LpoB
MKKLSWMVCVIAAALLALSGCAQPPAETSDADATRSAASAEQTPKPAGGCNAKAFPERRADRRDGS